MGRQIQINLLALGLFAVSLALVWMLLFQPVYELTVIIEEVPTIEIEPEKVIELEPVSPRERAMFDYARSVSRYSY